MKTKNTVYKTKKEAIAAMLEIGMHVLSDGSGCYFPGSYTLNYGEYAQPDFKPRFSKNIGWVIKFVPYYLRGTFDVPRSQYMSIVEHDDEDYRFENFDEDY